MKFKGIIEEVESIVREMKDNGVKDIKMNFCSGLSSQYNYSLQVEETYFEEKESIEEYDDFRFLDLLIRALKCEGDIDEFSEEVDSTFNTKPHQIFIVNKNNYKKNTVVLSCNNENCSTCFGMFTCPNNNKTNSLLSIEIQPSYVRFDLKNGKNLGSKNLSSKYVQRFKQNEHLAVLFGKVLYKVISSNYELKGFKLKSSR